MRTESNSRGCVLLADIREQEKQQQCPPSRFQIDPPIEIRTRRRLLLAWRKTRVHMPACISWVLGMRKPYGNSPREFLEEPNVPFPPARRTRRATPPYSRLGEMALAPCLLVLGPDESTFFDLRDRSQPRARESRAPRLRFPSRRHSPTLQTLRERIDRPAHRSRRDPTFLS